MEGDPGNGRAVRPFAMIGIVGAGITGLALHHHLDRLGAESVVFESGAEPGGVIESDRIDGRVIERGPQRTRLTPPVAELVEAAGVGDEVIEAADVPLYVYRSGKLRRVPRSVRGAIATDLLSWRGKLRALLEPVTAPPRAGETVDGFLARAFGREVADSLVGPLYGGLYGSHPRDMYVEHSLARALDDAGVSGSLLVAAAKAVLRGRPPPPVGSFADGLQTLPRGLYERYRDAVHLDTPVSAFDRVPGGFELAVDGGSVGVDRVVLTTPADAAADLIDGLDPRSARHLRRLDYNPFAVVPLYSEAELRGAGYLIPFDEPFDALGATWNDGLLGRDGVYTCYLGGAKAPEVVGYSDARLEAIAAREFEAITGCEARPLAVHRLRRGMPAYDTTWTALDGVDLPPGVHLCTNYTARAGIPGRAREAEELAERLAAAPTSGASEPAKGRTAPEPKGGRADP